MCSGEASSVYWIINVFIATISKIKIRNSLYIPYVYEIIIVFIATISKIKIWQGKLSINKNIEVLRAVIDSIVSWNKTIINAK